MKWFSNLENRNEIPKNYQEAFKNLGNKLIFTEPTDINIAKENVKIISEKIQQEFIDLDTNLQQIKLHFIKKTLENFFKNGDLKNKEENDSEYSLIRKSHFELSEEEFIKHFSLIFNAFHVLDDATTYSGWGFTPKIAQKEGGIKIERNCLGITTAFGAYCKKRGVKIDMGISPDHPYVIAYIKDGIYLADGQSESKKLEGVFEDHGNYKIYRATPEDKIEAKILIVHDFDKSVVYEILENMEVLRLLALDKEVSTLPGKRGEGLYIALANKEVVEKINWKDLQKKLFPEIEKSFIDNKTEWSEEITRVSNHRKEYFAEHVLVELATNAQKQTSFNEQPFEEAHKALFIEFKKYGNEIMNFLEKNEILSDSVPKDVKEYFIQFKKEAEYPNNKDSKEHIYSLIKNSVFDKPTQS